MTARWAIAGTGDPSPVLRGPRAHDPKALALVLHGGREVSTQPTAARNLAVVRMLPIARAIERRSHGRVGAAFLRYAVRGWNGDAASPIPDAVWALEQLHARHPGLPVALVGHSMGGRVALELAGHEQVSAVVALAPWVAESYDPGRFDGTPLLVVHGRDDTVTDPRRSQDLVRRIREAGGDATFRALPDRHAMLRRMPVWHRLAAEFVDHALTDRPCRRSGNSAWGDV